MSATGQTQQRKYQFRRTVAGTFMSDPLYDYLCQAVDRVASVYPDEVVSRLVNIIDRSLSNFAHHSMDDFVEYGDYGVLDSIVEQVWNDHKYGLKSRPHIVVLYGPPGTGKTTWVRNAAKKWLEGMLMHGIYLEVTPGDFSSKFAGIPIGTLKAVFEVVSTPSFPSVLLFDEADGFLMRPQEASGGIEIEQQRLVAELKSAISAILTRDYPIVIAMTTNYKDAIVRADPAIGDRVTAWIEVPPPPLPAREKMVIKLLPPAFRGIWGSANPYAQANAFRALRAGADPPVAFPQRTSSGRYRFRMPWVAPVLPFEADYLIGYLIAWGWNPLDRSITPALTLEFSRAVALWDEENPLLRVYARGMLSELEMMRRFNEEKHGVGRSFLRSFYLLKRGVDDFEKLVSLSYGSFWSEVDYPYKEVLLGEKLEKKLSQLAEAMASSMMLHGIPPELLHHAISKQSASGEFIRIVNDVLTTTSIATNALRQLFVPFLASYYDDPLVRFADLRRRLGEYNRFVVAELAEGSLLEPLRVLLVEGDEERAWSEAKRLLGSVDEDLKPLVGLATIAARMLHRAIHTNDVEQKGVILLETYRDRENLKRFILASSEELDIKEWMTVVIDPEAFPLGGVSVYWYDSWSVFSPTLFATDIACSHERATVYSIAPVVGKMGQYLVGLYRQMKEKEESEEKVGDPQKIKLS